MNHLIFSSYNGIFVMMSCCNTSQKMAKGNAYRNTLPEPSKQNTRKHTGPSLVPVVFFFPCGEWASSMQALLSPLVCNHILHGATLYSLHIGRRGTQPMELQINQPCVISVPFFWHINALWVKLQGLILKARACGRHNHVQSRNGSKQWDALHGAEVLASNLLGSQKLKIALVHKLWR